VPTAPSQAVSDALAAVVSGLALTATGATAPAPVRQRKRLILADGDVPPLILVAVGDGEDYEPLYAGPAGGLVWAVRRPAAVAVVFPSAGKVGENADLRDWRDQIAAAVTAAALLGAGLTAANTVDPGGRPIFDGGALGAAKLDWSAVTLTVETLEEK